MSMALPFAIIPESEAGNEIVSLLKKAQPILEYIAVTSPTWLLFFYGY